MHDTLYVGRRFRTFNVLDEGVRECLDIEIDTSLPGERVVRVLERMKDGSGLPEAIRCDNGPELTCQVFVDWCEENDVEIRYIQPGKPNQNAYIERFNRTYRDEVLSTYLFDDLDQVREITWEWLITYNEERPHDALGGLPPTVFRERPERRKLYFRNVHLTGKLTRGLTFGNAVLLGPGVSIWTSNHQFADPEVLIADQGQEFKPVIIEDDVWLGANSFIMPGTHLGRGCVVSAEAMVGGNATRISPSWPETRPASSDSGVPAKNYRDPQQRYRRKKT